MRLASLTLAVLVLTASGASAQQVTYDFDKSADFSSFKTYAWVTAGLELPDGFNHQRVVSAVEAQLAARGLSAAAPGTSPDVLVAYHAAFDSDVRVTGMSHGFGPYAFGASRVGSARTEEILTGTLVVDIVDADTRTIVWRGIASKEIDVDADPQKRERNINRVAERLFKNYPPSK